MGKLGIALLICLGGIIFFIYSSEHPTTYSTPDASIKIASYNMQIFGMSKASNPALMQKYESLVQNYDIFLIEEIRDDSGLAFRELCDSTGYSCKTSSRAGSTQTKEQYGIMWDNRTTLIDFVDYNLMNVSGFERPPVKLTFELRRLNITLNSTTVSSYNITIYLIHTKPENTPEEINNLEHLVRADNSKYIAVMGDLNADCSYYSGTNFADWTQLIKTGTDTTTSNTVCTYDRIIVNSQLNLLVDSSGVDSTTDSQMSDHYLVFFSLN